MRSSLSDLESALKSVRASFRVVSGDLLLINPDVFPIVSVLCPGQLSDNSLGLVRLVSVGAGVLVVLGDVRSGEVSGFVSVEGTSLDLSVNIFVSFLVLVCARHGLLSGLLVLKPSFGRSHGPVCGSWQLGNDCLSLVGLVAVRSRIIVIFRLVWCSEMCILVSVECTSLDLTVNIFVSLLVLIRSWHRLLGGLLIFEPCFSRPDGIVSSSR